MPEIVWLIGPPGCGKSTWVKEHLKNNSNISVISFDGLIEEWAKEHNLTYTEACEQTHDWLHSEEVARFNPKEFMKTLSNSIQILSRLQYNIIIDLTNLTSLFFFNEAPSEYQKRAVIFKISSKLLKERLKKRKCETGKYVPNHIIENMIRGFKPLNASLFDSIEILNQDLGGS